jgi:hypothetical protein
MIIVRDVVAEVHRDTHEAELKTMERIFADVKSTEDVIDMLAQRRGARRQTPERVVGSDLDRSLLLVAPEEHAASSSRTHERGALAGRRCS